MNMMSCRSETGRYLVLNTIWTVEELEQHLPGNMKRYLANNDRFHIINATELADKVGLGGRINMIMQTAFFKLANILPIDEASNCSRMKLNTLTAV